MVHWAFGHKVRYLEEGATPEAVTLDFVQKQNPSFRTPKVLFYTCDDSRSYLFLQRLPGRTLNQRSILLTQLIDLSAKAGY